MNYREYGMSGATRIREKRFFSARQTRQEEIQKERQTRLATQYNEHVQ